MIEVEMLRPTADEMLSGLTAGDALKRRVLLRAKGIEQLPAAAAEMLGGVCATPALRHRILVRTEHRRTVGVAQARARRPEWARFTPAAVMAVALTVMIGLGATYGGGMPAQQNTLGQGIYTHAAGSGGATDEAAAVSLFAGEGANPPLVGINGRFYRMLEQPMPVPSSLIDTDIATVDVFTDEPSTITQVGVYSNVVRVGSKLYQLTGISKLTAVAAEVDGVLRLFQRVSYASYSLLTRELFSDTLDVLDQVASVELSGVGVVTDELKANELIALLQEFAMYSDSEILDAEQLLTIRLKNGLSLQLLVQGNLVGGCGAWACPEFFDEFRSQVETQ